MGTAWNQHRISRTRTHDIEIADLDGDGPLDLVARDQSSFSEPRGNRVYLWKQVSPDEWKDYSFECPHGEDHLILSDKGSHNLVVGDFNNDRHPDILGANHGGQYQAVELWLNSGL